MSTIFIELRVCVLIVAALAPPLPDVSAFVISHVYNESSFFVPRWIQTEDNFTQFLLGYLPSPKYDAQRLLINNTYGWINKPNDRAHAVIQDWAFTCNTRFVYDAYGKKGNTGLYMMQYDFGKDFLGAVHGAYSLPLFHNSDASEALVEYLEDKAHKSHTAAQTVVKAIAWLSGSYQPRLATFAATGAPAGPWPSKEWYNATADGSGDLTKVMKVWLALPPVGPFMSPTDTQNNQTTCDFWNQMASSLENLVDHSHNDLIVQSKHVKNDL